MGTFKEVFDNLDKNVKKNLMVGYEGETDISKVLDTSHLKNNLDGLIKEITRQPAVYAYWANLKRMADEKYEEIETKFEIVKSRYLRIVKEEFKSMGITKPTQKQLETKFNEIYKDSEWLKKWQKHLKTWKKRKKTLAIIEKAVQTRGDSFKSLSYLIGNMMSQGIYYKQKGGRNG